MSSLFILINKYWNWISFIISLCIGAMIGWIDLRPDWDDIGVTVFLVLGVSPLFSLLNPKRPWIWVLYIGVWIPIWNILLNNNYKLSVAFVLAFIGVYGGAYGRKFILSRF